MTQTVALLGTGIMGAGMGRNIAGAGLPLRVWNRTRSKAEPLAEHGAAVAASPTEAIRGADVVVTMLFDADSVTEAMTDALAEMPAGAVWIQMSTVGIDGTARLAAMAEAAGVTFVDAPVLGTRQPAETGALVVLASGPERARAAAEPIFDAVGSKTVWVGDQPGAASRLKLALNAWVISLTAATAQSVALAGDLGLDPRLFLATISGGATDSQYAQLKGSAMIEGTFEPAFGLDGAFKDSELILAAMRESGTNASLMTAVSQLLRRAAEDGHAKEDMAAVRFSF